MTQHITQQAKKKKRLIRLDGNVAYITLTKGYESVIDACDVQLVAAWNWNAQVSRNTVYARRTQSSGGIQMEVYLHRWIADAPQNMQIDHEDGNGLNNRRLNLRIATHGQNLHNQRLAKHNTSGLKGVSWDKNTGKWRAHIAMDRKRTYLGRYDTKEEAHAAYIDASTRLHGDFGRSK